MNEPRPVETTTPDHTVVRGELVTGGTTNWLVLVHDAGGDIDEWLPLRLALRGEEWNLLAFDLPGHGGSEGEWDPAAGPDQVQAGIDFARREGASHVAVVAPGAASMWALEAMARGLDDADTALADSLVMLTPGPVGDADPDRIRGDGLAKTILSGAFAPGLEDAVTLLQASIGWTVAVRFPTDARGTALLTGEQGVNAANKIAAFIREQAAQTGPGELRAESA